MTPTEIIKSTLSMRQVAERYGFEPNRGGYIRCPFHSEKTPSLKMYSQPNRGWVCLGCHAGGTAIDFVMRLFNLDFRSAVVRICNDFGILISSQPDWRETQRIKAEQAERSRQRTEFDRTHAAWVKATNTIHQRRPKSMDEEWNDEWVAAMKEVTFLEFKMMELEAGGYG
jgi:DNA primase